ncbi:cell surface protein [Apilactobacillus micheneri]|uniref:CdaR family protein n=1 Tax=Apilactobacillus micheneri TaxID=1899430 RepID=UPI000D03DF49|nr:CdaR family protein [Apilactobacillus micheneri]TPR25285.1 cell surface protein [Apilactobacillus micheneri]TPR27597.1 cell surface protein [Apilactobacillus micheneri]TPR28862.1 cell surface protein [Apilactobacillus micheneri]TPR29884.1 cell surface protein [Apilactobacillus micheneri]TPR30102.1 cell surface protein [Apilactobacillus micheneri]
MKRLDNPWFFRLISLIFAILLFVYVNQGKFFGNNNNSTDSSITQLTATKNSTLSLPLQLNFDNNKYFVTGYPEKVSVKISGPAALVTTTVNTQNFKVYADLSRLGVGHHRVRIYQDGLNDELKYKTNPSYINVNIQPRRTTEFPVNVKYDDSNIADGYHAGKAVLGNDKVKVTGAENEINKINKVVAELSIPQGTNKTVNSSVILEALDAKGKIVNVILTPSTTSVNLPISSGNNKKVPVSLHTENASSAKKYTLTPESKSVKVFGTSKELDNIKEVKAYVDVSGINKEKNVNVQLDKNLNHVSGFDPDNIKVKVKTN